MRYARNQASAASNGHFDNERKRQEEINAGLMKSEGEENPFRLWRELGELMTKECTVIRYNKNLEQTDARLWVQREERTSSAYGGNKVRKFEFLFPVAQRRGGPMLTAGGVGSRANR